MRSVSRFQGLYTNPPGLVEVSALFSFFFFFFSAFLIWYRGWQVRGRVLA